MSSSVYLLDGDGEWRAERDPLTGNRSESWHVELLNMQDTSLGRLDGVKGGEITMNMHSTIRGGGSLEYAGPPVDWSKHRIQPWHRIESAGQVIEWPVGVFIPAVPGKQYSGIGVTQSIQLYDKTQMLNDDCVLSTYTAKAGRVVTENVRALITSLGAKQRVALTDSTATIRTGMVWPAGTSKLRIINDLLASINYFSIWVDGYGTFRADPYQRPSDRLSKFGFVDDSASIYLPDFTHTEDSFNVPNRVVCISQGLGDDADEEIYTAVATDVDPASPFSFPSRGRWIVRVEENAEASNWAGLKALAQRLLEEGQQVGSTFEIKHAPVELWPNEAVTFRRGSEGIDVKATVESISYSMDVGALCATKLREVRS